MLRSGLTADEAAAIVIAEYKQAKIERVMQRFVGADWRDKQHKELLARVTAEVWEPKTEATFSNNDKDGCGRLCVETALSSKSLI